MLLIRDSTFNAMVMRSNRMRPTTKFKDLGNLPSPFLCLWDTGGAVQNNKSQQTVTK